MLAGADSSPRMRDAAKAVAEALPDARFRSLAGQAHGQVDPAAFASALSAFFLG
ncbi:hypothetical protein GCM10010404_45010 [Nonomuraea africana]|uniref:Alpha/beta hydrolase n=1 Tax=Nonomuraea africana TaxID=46171 RepID=A0ABR9KHR5_9ACTN|nr:hypothetical protein [Nonomuraea africana]MBE1561558.1 hypothetical protein [Nonomuraea africana]